MQLQPSGRPKEKRRKMDNNQPIPPPQTNIPEPVPQPEAPGVKQSNKLVLFLVLGVVLIVLVVGGGYLYMSGKQAADLKKQENAANAFPVTSPKPTEASLDSQLNDVNIATDDSDFTSVDQDLQGL